MTSKERQNIDLLGMSWKLAPDGREVIYDCQMKIWDTQLEVLALSFLFRNMQGCEISDEELYGLSLLLEKLGKNLEKISEDVGKSVSEVK